jgi:hypothetical protein
MEHPKAVEIIPFEGPRDLASVTARPPVLFLPEPEGLGTFGRGRQQNSSCIQSL